MNVKCSNQMTINIPSRLADRLAAIETTGFFPSRSAIIHVCVIVFFLDRKALQVRPEMTKGKNKKRLSVSIPPKMIDMIDKLRKGNPTRSSRSAFFATILDDYLSRIEKIVAQSSGSSAQENRHYTRQQTFDLIKGNFE
jgi:metal-responsive CopG/Arc/MetJ family transcriptional regulator